MENEIDDARFSYIAKDPRFRSIPRKEKKIVVDKRFQSMFNDKRFKLQYVMDKRGRKVRHSTTEDLKKFYDIESEDSEEYIPKQRSSKTEKSKQIGLSDDASEKLSSRNAEKAFESGEDSGESESDQSAKEVDLARGEGNIETSSSSSSDESSENEESNSELDHKWGELDAEAPRTNNATRRLALCNMNWDRIKADDLFVLVNSFKPIEGTIISVKIYPSDYGLQRMKIEEMKGPVELVEGSGDVADESENPEGSKFHMERLRKYQLNRLKYFYAVVECDGPETTNKIYEELDGMEYESSATQVDLRFVPDDIVFDQKPTSATYKMPDLTKYEANIFTTTALQQAKVDLTWDETDPDRVKTLQKAFKETEDVDLKAYLASSSEEDSEEKEEQEINPQEDSQIKKSKNQIDKYKELLASIEEEERKKKERDVDMEITWEPGLKEKTESLIQMKQVKELTPWQEYLEKKKGKKKQKKKDRKDNADEDRESGVECAFSDDNIPSDVDLNDPYFKELDEAKKSRPKRGKRSSKDGNIQSKDDESKKAELELLLMDEDDGKKHFNLKDLVEDSRESKTKKKRLRKERMHQKETKVDDFEIDTSDPRFAALYSSAEFNIDPSNPHFKKTKGIEAIIREKQKKRRLPEEEDASLPRKTFRTEEGFRNKMDPALSVLVKSVKSKTERFRKKD